jgi:hypothetical protein
MEAGMPIRDVPLRIVRGRYKLLYFVAWVGVSLLFGRWVWPFLPDVLGAVMAHLIFITFVVVAVRSFRGATEAAEPSRAWWRMTGTVRSSVVLAVLTFLSGVIGFLPFSTQASTPVRFVSGEIGNVIDLALAALYLNSAIRLRRAPDPERREPVTLAEPLKGLD